MHTDSDTRMPHERRRYTRTQMSMPVQAIRLDPDGDELVGTLGMVDISRGGIGAISDKSFYPGQRVLLNLPAAGLSARNVCGIICRCSRDTEGGYRVGIEFERPLTSLASEPQDASRMSVAA